MNKNRFDEQICRRIQGQLDSYIDSELLVETNLEMMEHFQRCMPCAGEAELRRELRERLRTSVSAVQMPLGLETRIRAAVREQPARKGWLRPVWAPAVAALTLCLGLMVTYQLWSLRYTAESQERYITSISTSVASIMRVGLGDHVHCAVFRKTPKNPMAAAAVAADIDPEFRGLVPVVRERVPREFELWMAHNCRYHGRKFVHLTFRGSGKLFSLVLARKREGESFATEGLAPVLRESGIPIYRSGVERFRIAAVESRDFLVYAVSDLADGANLNVMVAVAPAVQEYLRQIEG